MWSKRQYQTGPFLAHSPNLLGTGLVVSDVPQFVITGASRLKMACTMGLMKGNGLKRASPDGMPMRRVIAALFLASTVLLCHGLFGTLHQFSGVEIPVVQHSAFVEKGHGGEHSGGHLGAWECAAAILVAFLVATLRMLHNGIRTWKRFATSLGLERYFPVATFHLPRGPTAASQLQVFRL